MSTRPIPLRDRLAEEVAQSGDLRSPEWRVAMNAVPRHVFLPRFYVPDPSARRDRYWRLMSRELDRPTWLEHVYRDRALVTELDAESPYTDNRLCRHQQAIPTRYATRPGLVVHMLESLNLEREHTVLQAGVGCGYATALLCARVGGQRVITVESDSFSRVRVKRLINETHYFPTVAPGDERDGYRIRAPYDAVFATTAVHAIPRSWLHQSRPGARIAAAITGSMDTAILALLTVHPDGTASGPVRLLPEPMQRARSHGPGSRFAPLPILDGKQRDRPTTLHPTALDDPNLRFLAQFAAPGALLEFNSVVGEPVWVLWHPPSGSWATVRATSSVTSGTRVTEGGPIPLWSALERANGAWRRAGRPPLHTMTLTVTPEAHELHAGPVTWRLPN
ncbi:hypothetical protein [Allostreptomyces psammosilenae]|uniref:Protein-L-isoaspartate O-methyltransferase n=1 Tax=Allostreptomyces psammosilenae TaxID=1892865 RepID=A0A853A126_9ACTN|nr:hypothetical protein [Allostreptomyces psammosilenae]NYI07847.1 protein-L-isoaspartate O-methyltransferase [Allostreptomyces psammosilenae]